MEMKHQCALCVLYLSSLSMWTMAFPDFTFSLKVLASVIDDGSHTLEQQHVHYSIVSM